jgi:hypothetical protein
MSYLLKTELFFVPAEQKSAFYEEIPLHPPSLEPVHIVTVL